MNTSDTPSSKFVPEPNNAAEQNASQAINDSLLTQARTHLTDFTDLVDTRIPYSRYLKGLENDLRHVNTETLGKSPSAPAQDLVVINPFKTDIAIALGLSQHDVLKTLLPTLNADEEQEGNLYKSLHKKWHTKFDNSIYTTIPQIREMETGNLRVLIPADYHAMADIIYIPQITLDENINFINRHESWHRTNSFKLTADERKVLENIPPAQQKLDPLYAKLLALQQQGEALSDIGAVGDMLRQGKTIDLVDKVAAWRTSYSDDTRHRTENALYAFKADVEEMGLEKFRSLNDQQCADMYMSLAKKHGFSSEMMAHFAALQNLPPEEIAAYKKQHANDPDFEKGSNLYASTLEQKRTHIDSNIYDSVNAKLKDWSPLKEMEDIAVKDYGVITPETLVKSYISLQTGMQKQLEKTPDDQLLPEKMAHTQRTFINKLTQLDYVEENKHYNIDITKKEPAVADAPLLHSTTKIVTPQKVHI